MASSITLDVNGTSHSLTVHPDEPLALVLRNRLGFTGVKIGCSLEQCGACAVLVDGESTLTCVRPAAEFGGRRIETVEALGTPECPGRVQQALLEGRRSAVRVLHAGAGGRDHRPATQGAASRRGHDPYRAHTAPLPVWRPPQGVARGTNTPGRNTSLTANPSLAASPRVEDWIIVRPDGSVGSPLRQGGDRAEDRHRHRAYSRR